MNGDAGQPLVFKHYEILRQPADGGPWELGRGAMGVTYKARDTALGSIVALKVIAAASLGRPGARERFEREAKAAAQLNHSNIARVFHLGQEGDACFYAMEFIEGETLESLVRREGPLTPAAALRIAAQACRGLQAAHGKGLLHRDLKPSNLMIVQENDEPVVKVIDFGLVKLLDSPDGADALSVDGFYGTPQFASPEQFDPETPLDGRSDLYSLGATLWYLLLGRPPFAGSPQQVMAQLLQKPLPFELFTGQPPALVELLKSLLAKERDDRPADAATARGRINAALEAVTGAGSVAPSTVAASPLSSEAVAPTLMEDPVAAATLAEALLPMPSPAPRRPWLKAALATGALALLLAAGSFALWQVYHHRRAQTEVAAGGAALARGDLDGAQAAFELAQRFDPVSREAAEGLKQIGVRLNDAGNKLQAADPKRAAALYRRAADLGLIAAQSNYGSALLEGSGVAVDYVRAAEYLRRAAERGDATAQTNLGSLYQRGRGMEKSDAQAVHWYELAAAQNDPVGLNDLASCYQLGHGVPIDKKKALDLYHRAADLNEPLAQTNLGVMYLQGEGMSAPDRDQALLWLNKAAKQGFALALNNLGSLYALGGGGAAPDYAKAAGYYRQAAEKGNASAQMNLGSFCLTGMGVPADPTQAVSWFRLAALQGSIPAQLNLGLLYLTGNGVAQDDAQAAQWFRKAAEQESDPDNEVLTMSVLLAGGGMKSGQNPKALAQCFLAQAFRKGQGVPKDEAEAAKWMLASASLGFVDAQVNMGVFYARGIGVKRDDAQGVLWTHKAADQNDPQAMSNLGQYYRDGRGTAQDLPQALTLLTKAADAGNADAQVELGVMYERGQGVPAPDARQAAALYRKAADQNYPGGARRLAALYDSGQGVPKSDAEATKWYRKAALAGDEEAKGILEKRGPQ